MTTKASIAVTCGLLALLATTAWVRGGGQAGTPPVATDRPADRAAVQAATQQFARAFEKGDAAALAALFTETGEYHDDDGGAVRGRAALAKAYGEFFAKRVELKAEAKTGAVRFIGTDTAVEEGTLTVKAKDQPARAARYSALYARQGGQWLLATLKEWGDDTTDRANLDDIAWLIGTWESSPGGVTARTTYEWAPNKAFIIARYTIAPKAGEQPQAGTQVIGVDPASGFIRSWTFDSDGGIGEATWTWDDGRWAINSEGTLPDGSAATAHNFLTKTGTDTFTWKSVKRTLNGEDQPDIGPVTVKRVAGR
jgi:uncharacterized protein (TIGR02246 family)